MAVQNLGRNSVPVAIAGCEWDDGNRDKCQKHGVKLTVIEGLFHAPLAVFPDLVHSTVEERFKGIGRSADGRGVLIVFTLRSRDDKVFVRPISARYMHAREVEYYEKAVAQADKR